MKKVLIALLAVVSFGVGAATTERAKSNSEYVDPDRFVVSVMTGRMDSIITDTKTGCQYLEINLRTAQLLGCFDEYKKDTKKK
ncbi:hypothetical protein YUBABA_01520 [Serratia phage vB_SmaM-Yubaba]|nr:hypothetical protein SUREIYA_00850 [Serratia phage vB_SmaM-Sureiya]UQT03358.1 hypothetical protein YUBABA_01520 [Serratia phage vB_SmaM-Yubaba]